MNHLAVVPQIFIVTQLLPANFTLEGFFGGVHHGVLDGTPFPLEDFPAQLAFEQIVAFNVLQDGEFFLLLVVA